MVQKYFISKNVFFWKFGETLGLQEAMSALVLLENYEKSMEHSFDRFFDLSAIKKVDLELSDVSKLANQRKVKLVGLEYKCKSAIYAPTKFLYELAGIYQDFLADANVLLGIFSDIKDAENWLKVSLVD